MAAQYHYSHNGESLGPVSVEQLRQLAASGQLTPSDLVWREGLAEWVPAGRLKGLFSPTAAGPSAGAPAAGPSQTAIPAARPTMPKSAFPPTESSPEFGRSNFAIPSTTPMGNVPLPENESHEFRLAELGPPPPMHQPIPAATRNRENEPANDTTQVEIFAQQAKQATMAAGADAWKAVKAMAKNPVGGLRPAFENLGSSRAMQAGIFFAAIYVLVAVLTGGSGFGLDFFEFRHYAGIMRFVKSIVIGCAHFGVAVGGFAAVRAICKGQGNIFSDMFVAGASLVAPAILILAARILGHFNGEIILVIAVFAMTTSILILYSGFTTLQRVPELAATLAIPLIFLADLWLTKVIAVL